MASIYVSETYLTNYKVRGSAWNSSERSLIDTRFYSTVINLGISKKTDTDFLSNFFQAFVRSSRYE